MRITQWGEYGVHCTLHIAKELESGKATVSASDVADALQIDLLYTQQILQRLRKNNIIESVRGPSGGYKISKPAKEITMYDIIKASEGDTFEVICETKPINKDRCASDGACAVRPIWYGLRKHIDEFLTKHTVEDLLRYEIPDNAIRENFIQINTGDGIRS